MRPTALHTVLRASAAIGVFVVAIGCAGLPKYDSPREAMMCIADVAGSDAATIDECVGPGASELFTSGHAQDDREVAQEIAREIRTALEFEDAGPQRTIALLGTERWPFPIPLVCENDRWRFDIEAAREDALDRRIGHNELCTITTAREYVAAQREFRAAARDGRPPAYAACFISTNGGRDGLYWSRDEWPEESPIGPWLAVAAPDECRKHGFVEQPFHGYFFRVLHRQGAHAPGGQKSYLDGDGRQTEGFALLAWPAEYEKSGVMTFQVGDRGIVFEKDLGANTSSLAREIQSFDPDASWRPTEDWVHESAVR